MLTIVFAKSTFERGALMRSSPSSPQPLTATPVCRRVAFPAIFSSLLIGIGLPPAGADLFGCGLIFEVPCCESINPGPCYCTFQESQCRCRGYSEVKVECAMIEDRFHPDPTGFLVDWDDAPVLCSKHYSCEKEDMSVYNCSSNPPGCYQPLGLPDPCKWRLAYQFTQPPLVYSVGPCE